MTAADEAYARLIAAQRVVSPEERAELEREAEIECKRHRINRKLAKVY